MKILITLSNPIPLIIHETLSLAFALASFGHELQLDISDKVSDSLLSYPDSSLTKMLAAFDLYDIPPAWVSAEIYQQFMPILPASLVGQIIQKPIIFAGFDTTIRF